jgi:hypothetical protein
VRAIERKVSSPDHGSLVVAFFVLLAACVTWYTWHSGTSGFLFDDAMYLLMADFFSPYVQTNPYVQAFVMQESRFPPGLPLLIAFLGGGSQSMGVAHLVIAGTFVASAVAYFLWMRHASVSLPMALGAVCVFCLLPGTLSLVLDVWSEYLYLAFVFTALYLAERARQGYGRTPELLHASAFCIGLSILTRTVGIALFGAFVLFLLPLRANRKLLYMLVAILPYGVWHLIKVINGYHGGYIEDMAPYATWSGLASLVTSEIPQRIPLIWNAWNVNLNVNDGSAAPLAALSGLLLGLAVVGLVQRLTRQGIDAYYAVGYIGLIVAWPYPDHMTRFVYPLVPFGIFYALVGSTWMMSFLTTLRTVPRHGAAAFVLAGSLVLIVPNALSVGQRFLTPLPEPVPEDFRHTRYWLRGDLAATKWEIERRSRVIALLNRIRSRIPEDQCVYATHSPFVMLHTQRVSVLYSKQFSWDDLQKCRYYLVMNLGTRDFPPMYPAEQLSRLGAKPVDVIRDSRGLVNGILLERAS